LVEFNRLAARAEIRQRTDSASLTERELEVLRLVADGLTNREIARELFIAENTVKNHVRNILDKLHLHSRMEAVVFAMRDGVAVMVPVVRGKKMGDLTAITGNVKSGEKAVARPPDNLASGALVKVAK